MKLAPRIPKNLPPKVEKVREGSDAAYIRKVKQLPCAVYGDPSPNDAHHLMRVAPGTRGVALRNADRWAIPLSRRAHDELHQYKLGSEEDFLASKGVLGRELAMTLWECRDDLKRMERVLFRHLQKCRGAA